MRKRVLIADDNPYIRRAMRKVMESAGFDVCGEAENGALAVEQADQLQPDLILLDLSMPVMNGIETAHALRRFVPETPIVVFSEYGDLLSEHEVRAEGISALVSKTEPVSVLLDKARAALHSTADRFL